MKVKTTVHSAIDFEATIILHVNKELIALQRLDGFFGCRNEMEMGQNK